MRRISLVALLAVPALFTATPAASARTLGAPGLISPANGSKVLELPAVSWRAVRGAAEYEYQISADPNFRSLAETSITGGNIRTHNLAGALSQVVPDATYWWRARAVDKNDHPGRWSAVRRIVKAWNVAPQLTHGDGVAISWPADPLVLSWTHVPYAVKYMVQIATDPALSNIVVGPVSQPQYTESTNFVLPTTLPNGTYYWAITPVDAEGNRGTRSTIGSFSWNWPTSTTTTETNLSVDPDVIDPFFTWNPIPGAARYEVEINQHPDFPAGSKWCCDSPTIGTSLAPQHVLGNNSTYWWRIRAIDANGNAGQWNYGQSFTEYFHSDPTTTTPSISNLTVRDASGNVLSGVPTTDTPIVTWDPISGASRYEVQLGSWNGSYCDWSNVASQPYYAETATTAWTPLGQRGLARPGPSAWPNPQYEFGPLTSGATYCLRVEARRDDDAQSQQVVSKWTYLNSTNDPNQPSFHYAAPPSAVTSQTFGPFTPSNAYICPGSAGCVSPVENSSPLRRNPVFTWNWLPGALGYFVVVSRDASFTDVADVGFTNVPAYAPRLANSEPLADKDTAYYWAVIPTQHVDGTGFNDPFGGNSNGSEDNPQSFNKSSVPPTLLGPDDGTNVSTWPTFKWTAAEGARNYRLQVSTDPSFGNPIDDITTDSTAYTSSSTYPADQTVYWRVRANDWIGQGMNWSAVRTFTRRLPSSAPTAGDPTGGDGLPVLYWQGVPGAISYDVHIDNGNNLPPTDATVDSTAFAATERRGKGTIHWQVQPNFPTSNFLKVGGGFFSPQPFLLTLSAPTGAHGVKSGSRFVLTWNPDPAAKQYEVDISNTDGFGTLLDFHRIDGTSWAPDINFSLPGNRGRLFWRVAGVDSWGTVGSFATGSFGRPRRICTTQIRHGRRVRHCVWR
jgi:hypothetical protein